MVAGIVRRRGVLGDPAAVIGRGEPDQDGGIGVPGATAPGRGPEHRIAALTLAALLFIGGSMGMVNLLVDGVLRDGAPRLDLRRRDGCLHGRGAAPGRPAARLPMADLRAGRCSAT